MPSVREVNASYENGAFYIITYALSGKMKHLESNSAVAMAGEWFTAHMEQGMSFSPRRLLSFGRWDTWFSLLNISR